MRWWFKISVKSSKTNEMAFQQKIGQWTAVFVLQILWFLVLNYRRHILLINKDLHFKSSTPERSQLTRPELGEDLKQNEQFSSLRLSVWSCSFQIVTVTFLLILSKRRQAALLLTASVESMHREMQLRYQPGSFPRESIQRVRRTEELSLASVDHWCTSSWAFNSQFNFTSLGPEGNPW